LAKKKEKKKRVVYCIVWQGVRRAFIAVQKIYETYLMRSRWPFFFLLRWRAGGAACDFVGSGGGGGGGSLWGAAPRKATLSDQMVGWVRCGGVAGRA